MTNILATVSNIYEPDIIDKINYFFTVRHPVIGGFTGSFLIIGSVIAIGVWLSSKA